MKSLEKVRICQRKKDYLGVSRLREEEELKIWRKHKENAESKDRTNRADRTGRTWKDQTENKDKANRAGRVWLWLEYQEEGKEGTQRARNMLREY